MRKIRRRKLKRLSNSIWREFVKKIEPTGNIEQGEMSFKWRRGDPSLRDQLYERVVNFRDWDSYFDAVQKGPWASEATKRSWRKVLGL